LTSKKNKETKPKFYFFLALLAIGVFVTYFSLSHPFRKAVCKITRGEVCINVFMGINHLPDEGDRIREKREKS